jgi:hypothetical protein
MLVYGALFGTGKLILHEVKEGVILLLVAVAGLGIIYRDLSRRGWSAVVD